MAASRKYPDELRKRATRLAIEARKDPAGRAGAIKRIADQLRVNKCAWDTLHPSRFSISQARATPPSLLTARPSRRDASAYVGSWVSSRRR